MTEVRKGEPAAYNQPQRSELGNPDVKLLIVHPYQTAD